MKNLFLSAIMSTAVFSAAATISAQEFSYKNSASWGGLCQNGKSQSPIDINGTEAAQTYVLNTHYSVSPTDMSRSQNGVMQYFTPNNQLKVGTKSYILKAATFHTPSEHSIMGRTFDAEIHFLHEDTAGQKAVIAVMVTEGAESLAMNEWLQMVPQMDKQVKSTATLINARDLMPFNKSYYRYMGSMTTPPCTEGVSWYILKTPITLSKQQLAQLSKVTGQNARAIQARNFRLVIDTQAQ